MSCLSKFIEFQCCLDHLERLRWISSGWIIQSIRNRSFPWHAIFIDALIIQSDQNTKFSAVNCESTRKRITSKQTRNSTQFRHSDAPKSESGPKISFGCFAKANMNSGCVQLVLQCSQQHFAKTEVHQTASTNLIFTLGKLFNETLLISCWPVGRRSMEYLKAIIWQIFDIRTVEGFWRNSIGFDSKCLEGVWELLIVLVKGSRCLDASRPVCPESDTVVPHIIHPFPHNFTTHSSTPHRTHSKQKH